MFYPKPNLKKKTTKAKINFTNFVGGMDTEVDEALLPYKTAKLCYNFNVKNGALKNGYGVKELALPGWKKEGEREILPPASPVKKIWYYKYFNEDLKENADMLVFYTKAGEIYILQIESDSPMPGKILENLNTTAIPKAINYRLDSEDTLIISSETDGMWKYVANYDVKKIENAPHIKSMCLHYERLFAVVGGERNRLAFSANLDPTDWTEDLTSGGFIEMQDERGALGKVISFNDYIYVFRDYGVARVSAYGDQTDFSVSQLFVSSVKLYTDTVTVCGDKTLLLARDGLHVFNGYSTKKMQLGIDKLFEGVDNSNACGVYYNNKFLLACRLNFNDGESVGCEAYEGGYVNNALIELDLTTNEISITRGIDISSMQVLDTNKMSKVAVCLNGEHENKLGELTTDGKVFGEVLPKMWKSPKSNMGYPTRVKHIKECLIKSKTDCKVFVATDKCKKTFEVKGADVSKRYKLNMFGEQIELGFYVNSDGDTDISCPQIEVEITN